MTSVGVALGTPAYMAPEQATADPAIDSRADIYSFGVSSYHMLAGEPPFKGETPFEVALQHVQKEPEPLGDIRPDLPAELCAIVHRMMTGREPDGGSEARRLRYECRNGVCQRSWSGAARGSPGTGGGDQGG